MVVQDRNETLAGLATSSAPHQLDLITPSWAPTCGSALRTRYTTNGLPPKRQRLSKYVTLRGLVVGLADLPPTGRLVGQFPLHLSKPYVGTPNKIKPSTGIEY